jgi:integrase
VPAEQRGQVYKTKTGYGIRWYDETGKRRRRSGFKSRSEARRWYEEVERRRMRGDIARPAQMTFAELVERYLRTHAVGREASTMTTLSERLAHSLSAFGELRLSQLERMPVEIAEWRTALPERSRYGIVQALRQTLDAAVRWGLMNRNPAKLAGSNPQPRLPEIEPFSRAEVDRLAVELGPWGLVAIVASETGLRPSEWIALEWRDISRGDGVVLVQRTFARGRLKAYGKTDRSRRRVPLSTRALDALDSVPRRINSRLVFPAPGGGNRVRAGHGRYLDLHNWRAREWLPAFDAAGLPRRRVYDLRHSFATWALAAGLSIFELARYMGTSVDMIDRTYGHLARGSEKLARAKLDAHAATDLNRLGQDRATP